MLNALKYVLLSIVSLVGLILIFFSIALRAEIGPVKSYFNKRLSDNLELREGSKSVEYWINPPAFIYRKFYFFNVINSNDILNGKKPIVEEIGPYSYREIMEKKNFKHLDKNTVSYTSVSTLYFDIKKSNGSENDTFTSVSLLDMGVYATTDKIIPTLFKTRTVNEYISGYKDKLLDLVAIFTGKRIEKFGLYSEKNGTGSNHFVASTGSDNIMNIGKLKSWNNLTELKYWSKSYANAINGSDGSKYPPNVKKDQKLYLFNPDLCRSISLEYLKENQVEGVQTLDFHLDKNIFSNNETLNPLYSGFCSDEYCLGSGVQSIRGCRKGMPMYISLPHFLNADEKFNKGIVGMNPNASKHDYVVSIEPLTGTSIKSNIRIQFNYLLRKGKEIKKGKDVLVPLFWLELEIDTYKEVKEKLSVTTSKVKMIKDKGPIIGLIIGSFLVCISLSLIIFIVLKNIDDKKKQRLPKSKLLNRRFEK